MNITKQETSALKGLCIIMIVLHNVIHQATPPLAENEFQYAESNVSAFYAMFFDAPLTYFLSFFGWLGVSFFIFISGYGLTSTYGTSGLNTCRWITRHYLKLELLLFPALFVFFLLQFYYNQGQINCVTYLLQQSLVLNVINPGKIVIGIWWYIGMAFQLYLWFLLLRKVPAKYLIAIALASCLLIGLLPQTYVSYLRHNSIGWMPEFIFGMLAARNMNMKINKWQAVMLAIAAIIATIAFSLSRYTFFLSGVSFVTLLLVGRTFITKSKTLIYIGKISASLYVVHAVVRWVYNITARHVEALNTLPIIVSGLIVLFVGICVSVIYNYCFTTLCKRWLK